MQNLDPFRNSQLERTNLAIPIFLFAISLIISDYSLDGIFREFISKQQLISVRSPSARTRNSHMATQSPRF